MDRRRPGWALTIVAAVVALLPRPAVAQDPSSGPAPICRPAPDARYGRTAAHPIQVGGGPMYGSARQRRFLDSLSGPKGQPVRYPRNVSTTEAPDGTLVDAYE